MTETTAPADAARASGGDAPAAMSEHRSMVMQMLFGFFPAQVLQVAARLGIADELAAGPRTTAELAQSIGAHEPSLYRLLRALVSFDLLAEDGPGRFTLTDRGALLRSGAPGSIRNLAMLFCGHETWRAWGELERSVRTGKTAWEHLFGPPFEYLAAHPDLNRVFNEAMAEASRVAAPGVAAAADCSRFATVADLGGGNGTLLAAILGANPHLQGMLFDTPAGLQDAPEVLEAAGVTDRCRLVAGDFFESVPEGADAYLLKSVIHDWDDERSAAILRNCRTAMSPDATLLIAEPILPARVEPSRHPSILIMSDLNMLACTGGKERTEEEFRTLLDASGFTLQSVAPCPGPTGFSVLEATPRVA